MTAGSAQELAVEALRWLVSQTGEETIRTVLTVILAGDGPLANGIEQLVAAVLRSALDVLGPDAASKVIDEAYAAARAAADIQAEKEL